jgi:hypothetical protein
MVDSLLNLLKQPKDSLVIQSAKFQMIWINVELHPKQNDFNALPCTLNRVW